MSCIHPSLRRRWSRPRCALGAVERCLRVSEKQVLERSVNCRVGSWVIVSPNSANWSSLLPLGAVTSSSNGSQIPRIKSPRGPARRQNEPSI